MKPLNVDLMAPSMTEKQRRMQDAIKTSLLSKIKTGLTSPTSLKIKNMNGQVNKKVNFEFKIMHWNILSQKRADNEFTKIIPD